MSNPVVLKHGQDVAYANDGRPTYARELKRRVAELTAVRDELERAIATYEKVIATWSPEKYPTSDAPAKVETVHMEIERKHPRFAAPWKGVVCKNTRPGYASDKLAKTTDTPKVTCKACKRALGLP